MITLVALAVGLVAGVLGGMLGIGGGTVTVPAMVLGLDIEQHTAQGIALCAMLAAAVAGTVTHARQGHVKRNVFLLVAPAALAFTFLGAWAAGLVPADWLTRVFAVVLLVIGIKMLLFTRGGKRVSTF